MDFLHIDMVNMPLLEWVRLACVHNPLCFLSLLFRALIGIVSHLLALEAFYLAEGLLHKAVAIAVVVSIAVVVATTISLPGVVVVVTLMAIVIVAISTVVLTSTVIASMLVVTRTSTSLSIRTHLMSGSRSILFISMLPLAVLHTVVLGLNCHCTVIQILVISI